ncbi:unnamed protein product [Owenia fusiformis]|uniref:Uncharacterized protein n=1 Tax=Owenia fusiformis TaxID=6347 RepID=A0A8J1UV18_OWEFU|nr:unnamed protein product [Owenia fusiformis]
MSDKEIPGPTKEQKSLVFGNIKKAIILAIALTVLTYFLAPSILINTVEKRLIFTLRCQIFSVLTIMIGIQVVGGRRAETPAMDSTSPYKDKQIEIGNKYLQNTVEQIIMNKICQLILSTYIVDMKWIMLMEFIFVSGRVMFLIGYLKHPLQRSFGFAFTFLPTVAVILLNIANVLFYKPWYGLMD